MRVLYIGNEYTGHDHRFLTALASTFETYFLCFEDRSANGEVRSLPSGVVPIDLQNVSAGPVLDTSDRAEVLVPLLKDVLAVVYPDVVYAGPIPTVAYLAALADAPALVVMSWGSDILVDAQENPALRRAATYALAQADLFVCDCETVHEVAATLTTLPRTVVLPWGVDPVRFSPGYSRLRAELGWEEADVVLSLRSWEPIYDVLTVVEAFRRAHAANPRLRLLMPGDGSQAHAIEQAIRHAGLTDVVHLPGRVPHDALLDVYRAADVYVSAALSDGSSVSLLEAMAVGLPVIVTDIPSNREWVSMNDVGGWCVPASNAEAFAEAMQAAIDRTPEERTTIREQHQAIIRERADWGRNVTHLLQAIGDVRTREA